LQAITVPTLLVVGEDDPGTPVAAHEVIQQKITGSKLVVIPGARHFSNVEQQAVFNAAITAFLAEQV
jgi:pimeloyl-ACP methyl ester carboxylesterase